MPGISRVSLAGVPGRQVNVYLDPAQLAARGLTLMDVRQALRSRNRDVSGGDMDFGKRRYMIRTIGRFEEVSDIDELILAERNGAFIRLRDVGYAEMGKAEQRSYSFNGGQPALSMSVNKQSGANIVEVLDGLMAAVEELNAGLAGEYGLEIQLTSEDVRYVKNSVRTVLTNLTIGAVLASLVLLAFLRSVPATLIGALGIPICTLAAFLGLSLLGRTINVISLAGVAFAIGMTLDNSIVPGEHLPAPGGGQAALPGNPGRDYRGLARDPGLNHDHGAGVPAHCPAGRRGGTVIRRHCHSHLCFNRYVDAGCGGPGAGGLPRFLGEGREEQTYVGAGNRMLQGAQMAGGRLLSLSQKFQATPRSRGITLAVTLLITVAVFRFLTPATSYLPEGEESKIFALMFGPSGYNVETMIEAFQQVDPGVSSQLKVSDEAFEAGEVNIPPPWSATCWNASVRVPERLSYVTEPIDPAHTTALKDNLGELFRSVPGMRSFTARGSIFSDNRGGTRSINVEISGRDLGELYSFALEILRQAEELFNGAQIRASPPAPSLHMSQPMAYVRPDWDRAAELRVSQSELGYTLWAYSDGAVRRRVLPRRRKTGYLPVLHPGQRGTARRPGAGDVAHQQWRHGAAGGVGQC